MLATAACPVPPPNNPHLRLMEAIRKGFSLRHVSEEQKSLPCTPKDSRGQMLDMIRQGVSLKEVKVEEGKAAVKATAPGIEGIFQRAMQWMEPVDSLSSDKEKDDEWED